MKKLKRYFKLYLIYFSSHLKVMMEYKADFLIGMGSVLVENFVNIFFLGIVFSNVQLINGWNFYEILFIYAIAFLGRSIHHIFFDNLWTLGWQYIRNGNFDRILLRPANPLFQVLAERVQQDGFGQLVIGILVLFYSTSHLSITWNALTIFMLILFILSSGLIFVALNLFFITFSFWMVDSLPLVSTVFQLSEYARYPISIYPKVLAFLITWIIPYGFTAFYPATYFLDKDAMTSLALLTPLVAIVSFFIAYRFWNFGIRKFTSTGS
ncbi:MAG: ABC transporter permease [Bacillaceae bacterium]